MKRVVVAHRTAVTHCATGTPSVDSAIEQADPSFSSDVIAWQKRHGRHALPWQNTRDAYRIWLSEIMLQQTQVAAVIPYYNKFILRFPDVASLASAPADEVMSRWSGLGYYSRARNLHRCAQRIMSEHGGALPADAELLAQLPGIGRSTAAAIAAFSFGARAAIMDGNVKRVFCRVFGVTGFPGEKAVEKLLWRRAEALLPASDMESYTQGLMDLGATLCTRSKPACERCPLAPRCVALATNRVTQLPQRKPKKAVPERQTTMLIVAHDGQVLLQQRPDSGIWGGLLSLPEIEYACAQSAGSGVLEAGIAQALAPFGVFSSYESLQPFSHGFSHFKLNISPLRIRLSRRLEMAGQLHHVWYDQQKLAAAPLPAPVKKLLLGIFREVDQFAA